MTMLRSGAEWRCAEPAREIMACNATAWKTTCADTSGDPTTCPPGGSISRGISRGILGGTFRDSFRGALVGAVTAGCVALGGGIAAAPAGATERETPEAVLEAAKAVVHVRAEIPPEARTTGGLGRVREGSGVVIDSSGLILTIGYLIMEAMAVQVTAADGRTVPAEFVGYDYDSGFGLVRAMTPLEVSPVRLGDSEALEVPTRVTIAASEDEVQHAVVVSRREFAGYWEYMLPKAIFTSPPHMRWSGAGLFDENGRLVGIGSLIVGDAVLVRGGRIPGNMFVPIDELKPILGDLISLGRAGTPAKPWLGVNLAERGGRVTVVRVTGEAPASRAGLQPGDMILEVDGEAVGSLADTYRRIWALGPAGTTVPLTVLQGTARTSIEVESGDRYRWLQLNPSY